MRSEPVKMLQGLCLAGLVGWLCILPIRVAARTNAFSDTTGSWFGRGRIYLSDATTERIRCRARYAVWEGGQMLHQHLLCASASYRFNINSTVSDREGHIFGTWSEATRNITGSVTGIARNGRILATVNGGGFTARLALLTNGNSQAVTIMPAGSDVREVAVVLRRG
jgi:hypothetical protein